MSRIKSLITIETGGVKRCVTLVYCPTPYQYLSCRCHQCQFLWFPSSHQSVVESSQRTVLPLYATKSTHIQTTSQTTTPLSRNPGSPVDTGATLMWLGIQPQIGYQSLCTSFTFSQSTPAMHHHQDVEHIPLSHSRYSQQEFLLLPEMRIGFQMLLDSSLYLLNPLLQKGDGLIQVITCCFMRIHMIPRGVESVLLPVEHVFQVIQPIQQMLQLLHFWWQWFPWQGVMHKAEVSQCLSILWISLGSFACCLCPLFGIQWIRQTNPPSFLLVSKVGKGLLIATSSQTV